MLRVNFVRYVDNLRAKISFPLLWPAAESGVYATVKKSSRPRVRSASYDQTYFDDGHLEVDGPPLPYRGYSG